MAAKKKAPVKKKVAPKKTPAAKKVVKKATTKKVVKKPVAKPQVIEEEPLAKVTPKRKKPTKADILRLEKAKDNWDKERLAFAKKYDVDASYINGILKKPMKN